jgi:hypothetical protein
MTRLSRPFRVVLIVFGVFVAVWFVALRGHSSETGNTASTQVPSASAHPPPSAAGAPSKVYHGSAPGIEGLSRAIAKAHGAVAASEQNAQQLEQKSAQASSESSTAAAGSASGVSSSAASSSAGTASSKTTGTGARGSTRSAAAAPAMQLTVERELKAGDTVILLFWDPTAAEDTYVRNQLQQLHQHIAVHVALATQVALFGSITRSVQIAQTPTILIINPGGRSKTLTGLLDAYSIRQAIGEAPR